MIVTIWRNKDVQNTDTDSLDAQQKGFFFYHGDGTLPNYDVARNNDGTWG